MSPHTFVLHALPVMLLMISGWVQAASTPITMDAAPSQEFSALAEIFVDETEALDASAVATLTTQFRPVTPPDLARRYDPRVFWLRATMCNAQDQRIERWLKIGHPRMEAVTLYQWTPQGWSGITSGMKLATVHKPVDALGLVFPLTLGPGECRTILLQTRSRTVLDLNAQLWVPTALLQSGQSRQLMIAAGAGGSLFVALISFFVFIHSRQITYFYFGLLHFSTALLELGREGLLEWYLWPGDLPLPIHLHVLLGLMALLSLMFVNRTILAMPKDHPAWDRLFLGFAVLSTAIALMSPLNYPLWNQALSRCFLVIIALSLLIAFMAWRRGNKPAGYIALGYFVPAVMESLRQASNLALIDLPFTKNVSVSWALAMAAPLFFVALSEQSRRLSEQLMQSRLDSQIKSDFLARISHELHAPLNTIIGYARMLRRGSERLSLQEGTGDIERSGLRLLGMIEELLDQSRLDSGQLVLRPAPLALPAWLGEVERSGKIQAAAAGNVFVMNCEGDLPPSVLLDSGRLHQVLDNLVSNSNRHTKRGHIELDCRASKTAQADRIQLEFRVRDNGSGIPLEEQARIFEPFYQGSTSPTGGEHRRAGVGLGLSIASDLVVLLGGTLTMHSKPGVGTAFHFKLDCSVIAAPTAPIPLMSPRSGDTLANMLGLRVLLIDDDVHALNLLTDALASLGCEVEGATSGCAAIARLANGAARWDLVITDQLMNDVDGWGVLGFARLRCPDLPIFLMSGMPKRRALGTSVDVDFDAFLEKPVSLSKLVSEWAVQCPAERMPTTMAQPDECQRSDLRTMVRLGEITAIEDWCTDLRERQPELGDFAQQVRQAARRIDFDALERMAFSTS